MFAGRVKIVSHSSCRASAIFKYLCLLMMIEVCGHFYSWYHKLDCQFSELAKCPAKVHVTLPEPGVCCNISDPLISVIIYSLL